MVWRIHLRFIRRSTVDSGTIQTLPPETSSVALFDRLLGGLPQPKDTPAPRKPIIDRVIENYRSLRTSDRRLSAADKQRLDDHIARLAELQRRVDVKISASCGGLTKPSQDTGSLGSIAKNPMASRQYFSLMNEVVAMAIMCGTTRVANINVQSQFHDYPGSWHQDIAHQHETPSAQAILVDAIRLAFECTVLDLARRLDVEEANGKTFLDNSLLMWSQEAGAPAHHTVSVPIVTFGSAGGYFKTGNFVDYQRLGSGKIDKVAAEYGVTYNQWLGMVLRSMGLAPKDYEIPGQPGYGYLKIGPEYAGRYLPVVCSSVAAKTCLS